MVGRSLGTDRTRTRRREVAKDIEMAKIDITRTELVWPGKYGDNGLPVEVPRISLPLRVVETIDDSRATRGEEAGQPATRDGRAVGDEGGAAGEMWRNKLILGDNLLVMGSLLERFAEKIDLIYIDPPFATGADFSYSAPIGEGGQKRSRERPVIEEKAYRDTWGNDVGTYLSFLAPRLALMRDLLSPRGAMLVHVDYRVAHYLKLVLDELFGRSRMVNEIIWHYRSGGGGRGHFGRKHDTILFYSKGPDTYFDDSAPQARVPHDAVIPKKWAHQFDPRGKLRPDVWDIGRPPNHSAEWVGFPTQKPLALLEVPVAVLSPPGGLVADFFCGSGTALVAAEKLGRRWIGCDLGRRAIHVARKRLLDTEERAPFEVLDLGKHERLLWQEGALSPRRFGGHGENAAGPSSRHSAGEGTVDQRERAYLAFILEQYGARREAGMTHLHGKKGAAMVHIGAVDAPVAAAEIERAVEECAAMKQAELHILGWEWEVGIHDLLEEAAKKGVNLLFLQIPREVMENRTGTREDVPFLERPCIEAKIVHPVKGAVQVALRDFVIRTTQSIPRKVRSNIATWSDYIDYWAVDWDFQHDTFRPGWVAYRTRKARGLPLVSAVHPYPASVPGPSKAGETPGRPLILVKVIDIFGNETARIYPVEV